MRGDDGSWMEIKGLIITYKHVLLRASQRDGGRAPVVCITVFIPAVLTLERISQMMLVIKNVKKINTSK